MIYTILMVLFSMMIYAQEDHPSSPSVFVLGDLKKTSIVELEDEDQEEVLIAVPRLKRNSGFRVAVHSKQESYLISIENKEKNINLDFYNYNNIYYGGKVELGEKFGFNGDVFLKRSHSTFVINHHHEYALYKINLNKFSIEPLAHQYFRFFQGPEHKGNNLRDFFIQPSNAGIRVKKQGKNIDSSVLFSVGPHFQIINPAPDMGKITPSFNLKISLTL